jgi:hypothetical protein
VLCPLIKETKRNIVPEIQKRNTKYIPHYNRRRIAGHLIVTLQKLYRLIKYQRKNNNILDKLRQYIMNGI